MKWLGVGLGWIGVGLILWIWWALRIKPTLAVGEIAPDFQLWDQNGKMRSLQTYRGRWLVLYFYPRDATPGCTREACGFRDNLLKVEALDAEIVGISVDSPEAHACFAQQHHLPFTLLADTTGKTAGAYGALFKLGPLRVARRHTFILTPEGRVGKLFRQVDPTQHAIEVCAAIEALQSQYASPELVPAQDMRYKKQVDTSC